jgi:hypothetical protein
MKKAVIISIIAILICGGFLPLSYAQMAKEGSGDYASAKFSSFTILPMEKERFQANFDEKGIVIDAPQNCPLYNASFRDIGTSHAIKGKFTSTGFLEFTIPNGDKIYATIEAEGMLGKGAAGIAKFVGGTGNCTGITGSVEFKPGPFVKSGTQDTSYGRSIGKVSWKIP